MDVVLIVIVSVSLVVHLVEFLAVYSCVTKLKESVLELDLLGCEVSGSL